MNKAVIGIGSNIEPRKNIAVMLGMLRERKAVSIVRQSAFVATMPLGETNQPDFVNGAVLVETGLDKDQLKEYLRTVESSLGRIRTADKYAPRTIDLDIVAFNGDIVDPDYDSRDFLRQAVAEVVEPGWLKI